MNFDNLAKNKAFIRKEANRLGINVSSAYSTYYSRIFLERLALINQGILVVKGSFSEYVHLGELPRPVLDIDLSSNSSNPNDLIKLVYQAIYDKYSDILSFDQLSTPKITKNGVYKLSVVAKIKYPNDKEMIIPVPIDLKVNNNAIFETQYKLVRPLFTGDEKFYINIPSFEEHLAEKLYIVAHNTKTDVENTRVKDFYDIYVLHAKEYDSNKFSLYFQALSMLYGLNIDSISAEFLNKEFIVRHTELWECMKEKYQFVDKCLDFDEAVYYVKAVLREQIQKIQNREFTEQAYSLVRNKIQ